MPVPAIELKPRTAMALFDSAIRLCARSSGVWALTLPGGALVVWAVLELVEAITRRQDLLLPSALFAAAWTARGFFMAAACHYVDEQVLGATPPSTWRSLKAALGRAPSVIITAVYLPLFTVLTLTFTAGLAYFFLSAHLVGWAVIMKGKGHPLALYGTCARMLGPARGNASTVRWLFMAILLVGLNLHIGANFLIYLGRKLVGLDLTYAQRFASLDNAEWITVVAALALTLFEPLRAAIASLMLIDGRVRQEGLDLLAAVEQLPKRRTARKPAAAALVVLALLGVFAPSPALAQDDDEDEDWTEEPGGVVGGMVGGDEVEAVEERLESDGPVEALRPKPGATVPERLQSVARACGYHGPELEAVQSGAGALTGADQAALGRMVDDLELFAWTWQDCETVRQKLDQQLSHTAQSVERARAQAAQPPAAERAQQILTRPEFVPLPERVEALEEPEEEDPNGFWARFEKWWREFLEKLLKEERETNINPPSGIGGGAGAANLIAVMLIAAVVVLVIVLLVLAFRGKSEERQDAEVESAALDPAKVDPQSALSRPPEGWASLADELAAAGNYRDAVRSLYLALLSRLHRLGAIDYDPTLSNWDYLRQFRGHGEWKPAFRQLTLRFDFAWYGQEAVTRDGYLGFRALVEPMLANAPGTGTPGAPPVPPSVPPRPEERGHA